jgi:hypothetical protein
MRDPYPPYGIACDSDGDLERESINGVGGNRSGDRQNAFVLNG